VTTFNDHCAVGLLDRLSRAAFAVPDAMSVAGYDNAPIAQYAAINLTTVSQEALPRLKWAVRAAIERLEGCATGHSRIHSRTASDRAREHRSSRCALSLSNDSQSWAQSTFWSQSITEPVTTPLRSESRKITKSAISEICRACP
jgi:hypothetical protein